MSELLTWLGLPASILIFAWICFVKLDPLLRDEPRLALISWLLGDKKSTGRWTSVPVALFDRILAASRSAHNQPRIFVRPSVLRSLLLTVGSIVIITAISPLMANTLCPNDNIDYCKKVGFFKPLLDNLPYYGLSMVAFLSVANTVIDYVCLCKTRFFLGIVALSASALVAFVAPLVDIALTLLLWNVLFDLALLAWSYIAHINVTVGILLPWDQLIWMYLTAGQFRPSDLFFIYFWATTLTMLWMLLFVVAASMVKFLAATQSVTLLSQHFFNLDDAILERPLSVVGIIVCILLLPLSVMLKVLNVAFQ